MLGLIPFVISPRTFTSLERTGDHSRDFRLRLNFQRQATPTPLSAPPRPLSPSFPTSKYVIRIFVPSGHCTRHDSALLTVPPNCACSKRTHDTNHNHVSRPRQAPLHSGGLRSINLNTNEAGTLDLTRYILILVARICSERDLLVNVTRSLLPSKAPLEPSKST